MLVSLHDMMYKVLAPLIWLLKSYGLSVLSSLIQNSSQILQREVIWAKVLPLNLDWFLSTIDVLWEKIAAHIEFS